MRCGRFKVSQGFMTAQPEQMRMILGACSKVWELDRDSETVTYGAVSERFHETAEPIERPPFYTFWFEREEGHPIRLAGPEVVP